LKRIRIWRAYLDHGVFEKYGVGLFGSEKDLDYRSRPIRIACCLNSWSELSRPEAISLQAQHAAATGLISEWPEYKVDTRFLSCADPGK